MSEAEDFLSGYRREVLKDTVLPAFIIEKYRLLSCLREGDDREAYLIEDEDGRQYLLKVRDLGRPDSLEREFEILNGLSHPQIPRAVSYSVENGKEYMIRSWIPGRNLQEMVCRDGVFTERESVKILFSLCEVLKYLHSRKPPVIHRDIKPQNVILTPEGKCVLIDFGTARLYKRSLSEDTVYMGTRATAPPEQFGYGQTDERTDIYSLGMLMRYLAAGSLEKPAVGQASAAWRHVNEKCTAFDPDRRFRSISHTQGALKYVLWRNVVKGLAVAAALTMAVIIAAIFVWKTGAAVRFSDPLVERAVRQELGLSGEERIPEKRLSEVRQIVICGNEVLKNWAVHSTSHYDMKNDSTLWNGRGNIGNLNELNELPNLQVLVLDYQNITDITPLSSLQLQYLSLCGNPLTDLSPLEGMESLRALWLEEDPVVDASPLSGLTSLNELEISGTNLTDALVFSSLPLETLKMRDTLITDLTPLKQLTALSSLTAGEVDRQGMEMIQTMPMLKYLAVSGELEDLEGFSGFSRLNMLDLSQSRLRSLRGVEKLPHLEYFGFGYTEPENLEPLTASGSIHIVEMVGAEIADYTPLLRCENLETVHVGFSQENEARKQLEGAGLDICAWEE